MRKKTVDNSPAMPLPTYQPSWKAAYARICANIILADVQREKEQQASQNLQVVK